jgi:DNA-3-methyladenine glycosylase II
MAQLVSELGPCSIEQRAGNYFYTLVRSIISQQLSAKAADTIESRISALVPAPFDPSQLLAVPLEALRNAGLSSRKAAYIHALAKSLLNGRIDFDDLASCSDESVITALTELPGIGRWTAEMFLIFGLKRLDVLALGDSGLRRAARMLYPDVKQAEILEVVSEPWRPYRSVASWYLWKRLDVVG